MPGWVFKKENSAMFVKDMKNVVLNYNLNHRNMVIIDM